MNLHHRASTAPERRGAGPEMLAPRSGNVSFQEVTVRLGVRAQRLILDRISLNIPSGQFVCVLGPSGCGKSTLLNALAGFVMTSGGRIAVDGDTITTPGADRGVVFQEPTLFPWKTVLANVSLGPLLAGVASNEAERIGRKLLGRVGLSSRCESFPKHLSGGMQQRVGIARTLANNPRVLLMDEPFGALDAQTRETMQAELLELHARTRKTILFVTHDLDEAVLIADRIVVMKNGMVQEIMTVPLKRPRPDLGVVRGTSEFADTRYRVWQALHAPIGTLH